MYSLAEKFSGYKHGLVQLPLSRQTAADKAKPAFSFKPKINKISAEIEKRNWQFRMQLERQNDNFLS